MFIVNHLCHMSIHFFTGPVGDAILGASAASVFLTFPGLDQVNRDAGHIFCAKDMCPEGFALAYWFTLPPCTKPAVTMKIQNGARSCFMMASNYSVYPIIAYVQT